MAEHASTSPRVALAISAFCSDAAIIGLLQRLFAEPATHALFDTVIVVDSLGSGAIAEAIAAQAWPVRYFNSERNLGSAGNLGCRLDLAAEAGVDWCYCLNHDGNIDPASIRYMLATALSRPQVGAVYPLLHHGERPKPWEDARRSFFPAPGQRSNERPAGGDAQALWSSSNGALYSLAPYRAGLRVWKDLWMGYEDLGYGMLLHAHGWVQLVCRDAALRNIFDYKTVTFLGRRFTLSDKPAWYAYYNIRNLILIQRRFPFSLRLSANTAAKALRDSFKIVLLENHKSRRLALLWTGVAHGLAGRSGKGTYP